MSRELQFNQEKILCGSSLRHVLPSLVKDSVLTYSETGAAALNTIMICEVLSVPTHALPRASGILFHSNYIERVYYKKGTHIFEIQPVAQGNIALVAAGCRYSEFSFAGGLFNPVTLIENPPIHTGDIISNLGAMNVAGRLNYNYGSELPIQLGVLGFLVENDNRPVLLRNEKRLDTAALGLKKWPPVIVIIGMGMETGKTTCALALTRALRQKGYRVTFEKKTGGPFCRDWINAARLDNKIYGSLGSRFVTVLKQFFGRDFLDAAGIVSSHSVLDLNDFSKNSMEYTYYFLANVRPNFHLIEIAGNLMQTPNLSIFQELILSKLVKLIILCAPKNYDLIHHTLIFVRSIIGKKNIPIIISGPVANEEGSELIRAEVTHRFHVPIIASALRSNSGTYGPRGTDLVAKILSFKNLL